MSIITSRGHLVGARRCVSAHRRAAPVLLPPSPPPNGDPVHCPPSTPFTYERAVSYARGPRHNTEQTQEQEELNRAASGGPSQTSARGRVGTTASGDGGTTHCTSGRANANDHIVARAPLHRPHERVGERWDSFPFLVVHKRPAARSAVRTFINYIAESRKELYTKRAARGGPVPPPGSTVGAPHHTTPHTSACLLLANSLRPRARATQRSAALCRSLDRGGGLTGLHS